MQPLARTLRAILAVNPQGLSHVDIIYRSVLRNDFFGQGWGDVDRVENLIRFQKIMSKRLTCNDLVEDSHPIKLAAVKEFDNWTLVRGELRSPLANHLPGCLPEPCETSHFEFCLPKKWKSDDKPVSIHMSGTGDHFFWRRRVLLAKPLLRKGIASLLMENPYYGTRKPKNQSRSNLNHVDNIFLMGGGLILESFAILRWLESQGYGPFCLTGISMGGHMASLAATNWPKPIAVVPCLSWTSASGVFTRGVMSRVVNWDKLVEEYETIPDLKNRIEKQLCNFPLVARREVKEISDAQVPNITIANCSNGGWDEVYRKELEERRQIVRQKYSFRIMDKLGFVKFLALINQILSYKNKVHVPLVPGKDDKDVDLLTYLEHLEPSFESIDFMRRLMDHFTHLSNFEKPVDPELAIVVTARSDAYVLKEGLKDIRDIWPGAQIRYINSGHVMAYVKHQPEFKDAIVDAIEMYRSKYNVDGTPKTRPDPNNRELNNYNLNLTKPK